MIDQKIVSQILNAKVISFDIFDTLLERIVYSPLDVFRLLSKVVAHSEISTNNISELRKISERNCRNNLAKEEVTLEEIYEEMSRLANLPENKLCKIKEYELELERAVLKRRDLGWELFNICLELKKRVILTSDMYLSEKFIEQILNHNGYVGYDAIYLSSSVGKTKRTGELFKYILEKEQINSGDILHIGDNSQGDYSVPSSLGIKAILLERPQELAKKKFTLTKKIVDEYTNRINHISDGIYLNYVLKQIFKEGEKTSSCFNGSPYSFGETLLAPIVFSFCKWLKDQIEEKKIDTLMFLSRDSILFFNAFKILYPEVHSKYIKCSRRICQICNIKNKFDIDVILNKVIYAQTIHHYLEYNFGLENSDLRAVENIDIGAKTNKQLIRDIIEPLVDKILSRCSDKRKLYLNYLNENIKGDRIALVDIGYAGSAQEALINILEMDIFGFYLSVDEGIKNKNFSNDKYSSFINEYQNKESKLGIVTHRFIYESIFCAAENSFLEISPNKDNKFLYSEFSEPNRRFFVEMAHCGALNGVQVLNKYFGKINTFDNSVFPISIFDEFLKFPTPIDTYLFEGVEFEDKIAPKVKRTIISKDINENQICLWKEGLKVRQFLQSKANKTPQKNNPASIQYKVDGNIQKRKQSYLVTQYLKIENIIVRLITKQKKYEKYIKNRKLYLLDSKNKFLHLLSKID